MITTVNVLIYYKSFVIFRLPLSKPFSNAIETQDAIENRF